MYVRVCIRSAQPRSLRLESGFGRLRYMDGMPELADGAGGRVGAVVIYKAYVGPELGPRSYLLRRTLTWIGQGPYRSTELEATCPTKRKGLSCLVITRVNS